MGEPRLGLGRPKSGGTSRGRGRVGQPGSGEPRSEPRRLFGMAFGLLLDVSGLSRCSRAVLARREDPGVMEEERTEKKQTKILPPYRYRYRYSKGASFIFFLKSCVARFSLREVGKGTILAFNGEMPLKCYVTLHKNHRLKRRR